MLAKGKQPLLARVQPTGKRARGAAFPTFDDAGVCITGFHHLEAASLPRNPATLLGT